jgi:hypothetical protein
LLGERTAIAVNQIAAFLTDLEIRIRTLTTDQAISLASAIAAAGSMAVAILALVPAAKAHNLATRNSCG